MPYTVRLRGIAVGYSDLEERDPATRTVRGELRPGLGYDLIEPIFQLRAQAMAGAGGADEDGLCRYRQARAALALEIVDAGGTRVPAADIVIIPSSGGGACPRVEVRIEDAGFWGGNRE
jgi:hypothetical protein